jgi:predicted O-methyltransferase YrrM
MDPQVPPLLLREFGDRIGHEHNGVDIAAHMPYLCWQAAVRVKPVIAEFGVRAGNSTCAFLAGLLASGGYLWSVDLQPTSAPHWFGALDLWTFIQADALGDHAAELIPEKLDVLFVDLDPHSREQTAAMIRKWLPRVRPGGVARFHDTDCGGGTGVRDALDDYATTGGRPWVNREGSNGLGVIEVPA